MITEDYVSFETAELLKEKGMDKSCFKHYVRKNNNDGTSEAVTVCTLQTAMKWLREEKNILIQVVTGIWREIETPKKHTFLFQIYKDMKFVSYEKTDVYNTYEEAVEAALKYSLENLI